jgi:hypothetical protein
MREGGHSRRSPLALFIKNALGTAALSSAIPKRFSLPNPVEEIFKPDKGAMKDLYTKRNSNGPRFD